MADNLQNNRYQALINSMSIPKSTKVSMTLWGINIIDLAVIVGGVFIGLAISKRFDTNAIVKIALVAITTLTSLLLIMRTKYQRKVRNIVVLKSILTQDKGHYYPIKIEERKKGGRK